MANSPVFRHYGDFSFLSSVFVILLNFFEICFYFLKLLTLPFKGERPLFILPKNAEEDTNMSKNKKKAAKF